MRKLIYLACPYTHSDHYMMVARWFAVNAAAAKLMAKGGLIYSPNIPHPPHSRGIAWHLTSGMGFLEGI